MALNPCLCSVKGKGMTKKAGALVVVGRAVIFGLWNLVDAFPTTLI